MPRNIVLSENKRLFEFLFMAAEYFENVFNATSLLPVFYEICVCHSILFCLHGTFEIHIHHSSKELL